MASATEKRRILVNAVVSLKDESNKASDLGFKHTIAKSKKPYKLNLKDTLSNRNEDLLSHGHIKRYIEEKTISLNKRKLSVDATKQVFDLNIPTGYKTITGSASFKINGVEQHSSNNQATNMTSSIDYYLSGSRYEQLVLYKPRQDHSGLLVDNRDSLIINYRVEKA